MLYYVILIYSDIVPLYSHDNPIHNPMTIPISTSVSNMAIEIYSWLVVEPPLWKIWVNWDDEIPNIWENKTCSKPPGGNFMATDSTTSLNGLQRWLLQHWSQLRFMGWSSKHGNVNQPTWDCFSPYSYRPDAVKRFSFRFLFRYSLMRFLPI